MASTVTNSFKKIFLDQLLDSSENFYIGISRSDAFVAPSNIASTKFQTETRHGLIAVKVVSGISYVVPTVTWTSGTVYNQYTNEDDSQTNFYVVNSNREVFLCIEQGKVFGVVQDSIVEPTSLLAGNQAKTFATADGYKWRFLYKISNLAYSTYRTSSFTPVKKVVSLGTFIPEEIQQLVLQDSSVSGEILGVYIDSAGTGYTNTPTLTVVGNGTGASFSAEINAGKIVAVRVDSDTVNGGFKHGSGYDYANITLSSGNAKLRPILGPRDGTSIDPRKTLRSNSIMFQTQFQEDEEGTILTNSNNFYQVALIRNLEKYDSDIYFTGNTGNGLKILELTAISDQAGFLGTVSNQTDTVRAKFVAFDSAAGSLLYYYQDDSTGFNVFDPGSTIVCNGETASIVSLINPDFNAYTGDILYINNLNNPIDRAIGQIEDVRIVIRLTNC